MYAYNDVEKVIVLTTRAVFTNMEHNTASCVFTLALCVHLSEAAPAGAR